MPVLCMVICTQHLSRPQAVELHLHATHLSVGENAASLGLIAICGSFCMHLTPSCSTLSLLCSAGLLSS